MVLGSTLLKVAKALTVELQPQTKICKDLDLGKDTVMEAMAILVELKVAEKVAHSPPIPSGKEHGWIRAEYRLNTNNLNAIRSIE